MASFYNEIDPYAAAWLRNLIKAGLIPDGEVSTQSIVDLRPSDLSGFDQCHFFAGIGGWSQALHLAGWAPDRPVWTGSCPCQPFSVAGKGAGVGDPRHLWPHFHRLITAVRPPIVMGEQVAGAAGYGWLDGVRADLARENYASRGVDIPACAVDAPHIRQRLYWVASDMGNTNHKRLEGRGGAQRDEQREDGQVEPCCVHDNMAHADESGRGRRPRNGDGERDGKTGERDEDHGLFAGSGEDRLDVADTEISGWGQRIENAGGVREGDSSQGPFGRSAQHDSASFWSGAIWLTGSDGKSRRAQPGLPLLVDGVSNCLANVLSICEEASKRITYHAERSQTDPGEILRMVREHLYKEESREKQPTGVCGKLYAPQVLFDFMLSQATTCNGAADSGSVTKAGKETVARAMCIMRMDGGFVYPSHQWRSNEQQRVQPSDPLHELSFLLACDAQAFGKAVFDAHAAINRAGMLRAYGNAIVPQVAAEVIKALMETLDEA